MFLREVLEDMKRLDENKNPIPFNISVRTYEREKQVGGVLKKYQNATLMVSGKRRSLKSLAEGKQEKDPNHWENKTRNLKVNGVIKKINILFIIEYNGSKVVF